MAKNSGEMKSASVKEGKSGEKLSGSESNQKVAS